MPTVDGARHLSSMTAGNCNIMRMQPPSLPLPLVTACHAHPIDSAAAAAAAACPCSCPCSQLSALTELHLAYRHKTLPSPPNLAAEAAVWASLPLRQLSLHGVEVPTAVLQRLAELPGGVPSLELDCCEFEGTPRQVAKVLKGGRCLLMTNNPCILRTVYGLMSAMRRCMGRGG